MPAFTHRLAVCLVLLLASATVAHAQRAQADGFVVCLGDDTLAVERYRRSPTKLESEIVLRAPAARWVTYTAVLDAAGDVRGIELAVTPLVQNARRPGASRGVLWFRGDTAEVLLTLGDSIHPIKVAARPGSVPLAAFSHALVEQAILRALRLGVDSVAFDWVGVGAPVAYPSYVTRRETGAVAVGFVDAAALATLDSSGRMVALDGSATTTKVEVRRVADPDLERFARTFAADEAANGPVGLLSPRDSTHAEVGPASILIDYGRPGKRGRIVFGRVVPWGRVWRTGANAATQFITDAPILIGGHLVPPGAYSLWTVPRPGGATLIVNARTGQWGTQYDPGMDVARIEMVHRSLAAPVERFTIDIVPRPSGGELRLIWDRTQYLVTLAPAGPP